MRKSCDIQRFSIVETELESLCRSVCDCAVCIDRFGHDTRLDLLRLWSHYWLCGDDKVRICFVKGSFGQACVCIVIKGAFVATTAAWGN